MLEKMVKGRGCEVNKLRKELKELMIEEKESEMEEH